MPVLSDIANLLSDFYQYIICTNKLPLYGQPYGSLLYSLLVHMGNHFSDLSSDDLKKMPHPQLMQLFRITLMQISPILLLFTLMILSPLFLLAMHFISQSYMFLLQIIMPLLLRLLLLSATQSSKPLHSF